MDISASLQNDKASLLKYFRNRANESLGELSLKYSEKDYKDKAKAVNQWIIKSRETLLDTMLSKARSENWANESILKSILMITYTSDVVMLETRNLVWEYDYMAFSRRIGELWEPFCKICFQYPLRDIKLFVPPLFSDVKKDLTNEITSYISSLSISQDEKAQLMVYYNKVWNLVASGEIQLELDLHFIDEETKYVVDFKSGFGSNEKGNTNRLLLVGSIYQNIDTEKYKCLIMVRSTENNHYLNTLEKSGIWETSCGDDTYKKITRFTGFDLEQWIKDNINWLDDFSGEMKQFVIDNNLTEYLMWQNEE